MTFSTIFLLLCAAFFFCSNNIYQVGAQNNNIQVTKFTKLSFPPNVAAVGSLTFDVLGGGPYFGTVDGRIFRYGLLTNSWHEFGHTAPNRPEQYCNGATGSDEKTSTCGFTAGLSFSPITQNLYACDAYVGLTVLGPFGGEASTLVRNSAAFPPFRFPNSIEAAGDGNIYFVDSSAAFTAKESDVSLQSGDSTGRLVRYDPATEALNTTLSGLGRPTGVATAADASFLLIAETNKNRILKYFLTGEKSGDAEVFHAFEGGPNKIKRNSEGDFWVAVNTRDENGLQAPQAVKISPSGQILATLDLGKEYQQRVSTVMQHGQQLFIAGYNFTHIGRYDILP